MRQCPTTIRTSKHPWLSKTREAIPSFGTTFDEIIKNRRHQPGNTQVWKALYDRAPTDSLTTNG